MQDHFQIFHLPISQLGILYCFGQETILHSVRCARRKVLEPEKDAEGVIYVGRWWKLKTVQVLSVYTCLLHNVFSQLHRVLKAFVCKLGIMHYLLVIPCRYTAE